MGRREKKTWLMYGSGDKPLREALLLLDYEGVTSLAVLDNQYNVVGNISTVDVKVFPRHPFFYFCSEN